jgi:capsular polysaccharide biosynthesis protein
MPTEIIIATSTSVLAAAGTSVSPPIEPAALKRQVEVTALSEDVLQVQVSAATGSDAKRLANALASDFIGYLAETGTQSSGTVLAELQKENAQLTKQILSLQSQIDTVAGRLATERSSSPAGQQDASLLGTLRSEQEEVALQLNDVNSQIVTAQLTNEATTSATQILQRAVIVSTSETRVPIFAAGGAGAGLLIGCLAAVASSQRDRRLRLRDELAGAIGVPVVASISAWRCSSAKDWRKLVERYQPSPVDSWNVRRVLQRTGTGGMRPKIVVVALADDAGAIAAGVQLGRAAAEAGLEVALVIGDHPSLALLRTACSLPSVAGSTAGSHVYEPTHTKPEFSGMRLTLSVIVIDAERPEFPPTDATYFSAEATCFLAVSSGFATAEALARAALAASDAGSPIEAIVVVNPEPGDSTTGGVGQAEKARPPTRRAPQRLGDFAMGRSK